MKTCTAKSRTQFKNIIQEHQNFATTSTIDCDPMDFSVLDQLTSVQNNVSTVTTVQRRRRNVVRNNDFSFPTTVDVTLPVPSAQFGLSVATTLKCHSDTQNGPNYICESLSIPIIPLTSSSS